MDTNKDTFVGYHGDMRSMDSEPVSELFVGKSISAVDAASARITLNDGTELLVIPNQGECCNSGDFSLTELNFVENAITAVELVERYEDDPHGTEGEVYELFLYTAGVPVAQRLIKTNGNAGSGYYGAGFRLRVVA